MTSLLRCSECSSFVPLPLPSCPECGAVPHPRVAELALASGRTLLQLGIGSSFAVTLMACYGAPSDYESCGSRDVDRDGYCGQLDCNENDATVHSWADDPLGDGIDQDCDGADGTSENSSDGGTSGDASTP